jgi:hypothetical protein
MTMLIIKLRKGANADAPDSVVRETGSLYVLLRNNPEAVPRHHPTHGLGWYSLKPVKGFEGEPVPNATFFQVPDPVIQEIMAVEQRKKLRLIARLKKKQTTES